ncbi:MAG: L,D-transpeptidase family protein, partial [Pseudomonadota bacterium]
MKHRILGPLAMLALATASPAANAESFALPTDGDLIGEHLESDAAREDTFIDLARRHGLGYEELIHANPGVEPGLPGDGRVIRLPMQRRLPAAPRAGIVVTLAEHRLYYFPPAKAGEPRVVITHPIAVGKMDWSTPIGLTRVTQKVKNPPWHPPESVRKARAQRGESLPRVVPPGPDNPLGTRMMRLAIPGGAYLIHGTIDPRGIGMQATHGCLRLYPEDIESLFELVPVDMPVNIVNQPHKVGWRDGRLYVEVHPPLESTDGRVFEPGRTELARLVAQAVRARPAAAVVWERAETA